MKRASRARALGALSWALYAAAAPSSDAAEPQPPEAAAGIPSPSSATVPAPPPEDVARAKALFDAGAQAYGSGQFEAAIQAFKDANRLAPRPAIVYSLGQAHRRQYVLDRKPEHLTAAIASFRTYVEQVPDGGRRVDATKALGELEASLAALRQAGDPTAGVAGATVEPSRLMVTTQPTGAWVSIDGEGPKRAPHGAEVTPGKHRVRVTMPGYFDEEREVLAVDRTLVPVPVDLRPRPSRLTVVAPAGCDVSVDGRPAGITPLATAIELTEGTHLVVLTKNGYKAFSQEIEIARDEVRSLSVTLEITGQRMVAHSLLISGGALALVGGAFSLLALEREGAAKDIRGRLGSSNITARDAEAYDDARDARGAWTTAAAGAFALGGAALLTGVVFYVFDRPSVIAPRARPNERRGPSSPRDTPAADPVEMTLLPAVSPTFAGAGLSGRF